MIIMGRVLLAISALLQPCQNLLAAAAVQAEERMRGLYVSLYRRRHQQNPAELAATKRVHLTTSNDFGV